MLYRYMNRRDMDTSEENGVLVDTLSILRCWAFTDQQDERSKGLWRRHPPCIVSEVLLKPIQS